MAVEVGEAERRTLRALFDVAVATAHPRVCLQGHLPEPPPRGRLIVLAAGKAAAAMAAVAEAHYAGAGALDRVEGVATPPAGYAASSGVVLRRLGWLEGHHPTPDARSVAAAEAALAHAHSAAPDDLVLVLLSGGASALWAAPAPGLSIGDKTALTRGLLKCGADIHEMNTVRRHLSAIKGGRLRRAAASASFVTLAISDVPGDDPATIGSGPTVPDPTTLAEARDVLARRLPAMVALGLPVPEAVERVLADPANETPKGTDGAFAADRYEIVATPAAALAAAAAEARRLGYSPIVLGDRLTGEARDVARQHAERAREARQEGRRVAILSGGELSVTVRNRAGRGGRNQEYALALAVALDGLEGVTALAADTDGIDGGEGRLDDPAGAVVTASTLARARAGGLDAAAALAGNDATPFFEALGDSLVTGPTHTNVNDFRVILVDP
jgi:glycerate 2-kinase